MLLFGHEHLGGEGEYLDQTQHWWFRRYIKVNIRFSYLSIYLNKKGSFKLLGLFLYRDSTIEATLDLEPSQGNLLRGIVNWSGTAMEVFLTTVSVTMFLYFGLCKKPFTNNVGHTGKTLSEALIFASTNPKYDERLFIELQVQYSMVPNNSAARLLTFEIFSLPTRLIWIYTLIKIQIIFLPTCLLSIILNFCFI